MKTLNAILFLCLWLLPAVSMSHAYSQDPRSCGDPRTQYPSAPPCNK